jgi:SAM-dependent methyltransferase
MQKLQYRLMAELEENHFWFRAKREFFRRLFPPSKQENVLDLGCGTGGMRVFLENWGTVTRVESSPYAQIALRKRKLPYIPQSIEKYRFPANSYSLVCFFDVLYHQHIHNIPSVLKKSYRTLKKGGHLVIFDSALPFLTSHHDEVMMAKKRFYLDELIGLVHDAGFIVERKSYSYFFLFPLFLASRLIDKCIPLRTVSSYPAFINTLLLFVCKIEAWLLKYISYPIGSSAVILARKP